MNFYHCSILEEVPKNRGTLTLGPTPLKPVAWMTTRNTSGHTCVNIPNLVALNQTDWMWECGPKNIVDDGVRPLKIGGVADPRKHAPPPHVLAVIPYLV